MVPRESGVCGVGCGTRRETRNAKLSNPLATVHEDKNVVRTDGTHDKDAHHVDACEILDLENHSDEEPGHGNAEEGRTAHKSVSLCLHNSQTPEKGVLLRMCA